MRLADLIRPDAVAGMAADPDICGITADSREVSKGFLFAALAGVQTDGARFIPQAIANGAVAVLAHPDVARRCSSASQADQVKWILDSEPRRRFAQLAAIFYPGQPEIAVAVTGTNGKTSVADFTRQLWQRLGRRAASIGTLGVIGGGISTETQRYVHTTPPPEILHRELHQLHQDGVTHVALEASSHGLAQFRIDGVRLSAAALTNISRDHLDYHADEADYIYSKMRLFGEVLPPGGLAVLNREDATFSEAEALSWARGQKIIAVGGRYGDLRLLTETPHAQGARIRVSYAAREWEIELPLIGHFQAMNALTAAALVIGCGEDPDDVFGALPALTGAPGRLEKVGCGPGGAPVLVDYAHTPDALRTVLTAVRPYCSGRLHVLFGCGGDRDRGKRPQMGAVAHQLADEVIITDDNPRSEDPAAIRAEILRECAGAREIGNRASAIRAAIADLRRGDIAILAGKGHETGQIVGDRTLPFDDRQEAVRAIRELAAEGGQDDPG